MATVELQVTPPPVINHGNAQVYLDLAKSLDLAILYTPSGEFRNRLTELNIELMQIELPLHEWLQLDTRPIAVVRTKRGNLRDDHDDPPKEDDPAQNIVDRVNEIQIGRFIIGRKYRERTGLIMTFEGTIRHIQSHLGLVAWCFRDTNQPEDKVYEIPRDGLDYTFPPENNPIEGCHIVGEDDPK